MKFARSPIVSQSARTQMRAAIPNPKQTLFPSRDGREIRNSETAPLTDMDPVRTREIRPIALQPGHDLRLAEAKGAANEMRSEEHTSELQSL
jgi:hypothetical protein